eukprot:COSAG05_NODE_214_length_13907_cov_28.992178_3_plen_105_part_00
MCYPCMQWRHCAHLWEAAAHGRAGVLERVPVVLQGLLAVFHGRILPSKNPKIHRNSENMPCAPLGLYGVSHTLVSGWVSLSVKGSQKSPGMGASTDIASVHDAR